MINDLCRGAERPLLLIDAAKCRGLWPWVADMELDPTNILVGGASHAEADWGALRIVRVRTGNAPKVLLDAWYMGTSEECADVIRYPAPKWAEAQLFRARDARTPVYLSFGSAIREGRIRGASCYREMTRLKEVQAKPRRFQPVLAKPFTNQWSTPNAVEFVVVRAARGEHPDDVARLVQDLRSVYAHFGDWSTMPAPGYFGGAFKEYLADYDVDEDEVMVEGELEGEGSEVGE